MKSWMMMGTLSVSDNTVRLFGHTDRTVASRVENSQDTTEKLAAISMKYGSDSVQTNYLSSESLNTPKSQAEASILSAAEPAHSSGSQSLQSAKPSKNGGKKISFAAEPEVRTFTTLPPHVSVEKPSSVPKTTAKTVGPLYHPTERILELDDHDQIIGSRPLELVAPLPEDDPAIRDAQSMGSLGPIVAEMNLMGAVDDDTDIDGDDDDDDDDESVDENDFGMTNIGPLITSDYRAEMEALMKKHEAALKSVGSAPKDSPVSAHDAPGSAVATHHEDSALAAPELASEASDGSDGPTYAEEKDYKPFNHRTRKGVRFADNVDVSSAPVPTPTPKERTGQASKKKSVPFSEAVIERVTQPAEQVVENSSKKPSRFKAGKKAAKTGESVLPMASSSEPVVMDRDTIPPVLVESDQPKKVSRFRASRQDDA
jgi:hypothetical protein